MKSLALKLADIFDSRLGREEDAVTWYRRALEFEPENLDILAALEGALTVQMNWPDLVDVFERQIEYSVDDAAKFDKQLALAALFENQLTDVHRAINVYQELLENGSMSADVLMPLKRLLGDESRWYELARLVSDPRGAIPRCECTDRDLHRVGGCTNDTSLRCRRRGGNYVSSSS